MLCIMENNDIDTPYLSLGSTLMRVARCWRREIDSTLQSQGLSQTMVMPLIVLNRAAGPVRQGLIADEIGVEGPSLVRVIDALERDGLISRVCDLSDRRAKMVALTAAGKDKAAEIEIILADIRNELTADIDPENLATTLDVMQQLLDKLAQRGGDA
ncbi:MAG: MarR family transcriptional regulator [Thalassospira sp.]|jgi:MarR family transcriptional regulator for hemolysin|uniref:Transcriptional regulator n=2 Tax=Thalassospiraceae TaxID=2844866 RepID=A0ABR5Y5X3_9PROT|nr:transcriptional regulator [Thalassospira xiamenensis]MAB33869.1 transcriptional regulator [Thalassospira sp.]OCK06516.1 transcriptional regulator, MarR family [Thalassospira sp. KO164]OHZ02425.1 transcriptional regulator [Thalassospira sp. MIT1004]PXX34323.1 MarR family transcriptional regulator for hemolysin [Thalassospira sp. 11-3]QPL35292.1 MarR family transcriptional regulator [Thalassospira sp. B30-1]SED72909.1 MarR family transcriptional regulator, transcriptional regulator for hemol|tara:strand:- start:7913 stop:8383 length:471 start_codon:yes stop_codon:yes gene_type:complete